MIPSTCSAVIASRPSADSRYATSSNGSRFEYSFEKGVIVDPNCNIYNYEGSTIGDHIKVDVRDNNIIFNVSGYYYGTAEVIVNVRYESMYSRVRFVIK